MIDLACRAQSPQGGGARPGRAETAAHPSGVAKGARESAFPAAYPRARRSTARRDTDRRTIGRHRPAVPDRSERIPLQSERFGPRGRPAQDRVSRSPYPSPVVAAALSPDRARWSAAHDNAPAGNGSRKPRRKSGRGRPDPPQTGSGGLVTEMLRPCRIQSRLITPTLARPCPRCMPIESGSRAAARAAGGGRPRRDVPGLGGVAGVEVSGVGELEVAGVVVVSGVGGVEDELDVVAERAAVDDGADEP